MRRKEKQIEDDEEDFDEEDLNVEQMPAIADQEPLQAEKTWISLGNRQFFVEDVQSIFIQANHLIINFDYTAKQIVIFFGRNEKSYENARKVFDALAEMYNAYKIELPEDAILEPDILKTAYGDQVNRAIQDRVKFEKDKFKMRHVRKLKKALDEIASLKKKLEESSMM